MSLEEEIRRIIREELIEHFGPPKQRKEKPVGLEPREVPAPVTPVTVREPVAVLPTTNGWQPIDFFYIVSGSRRFTMSVGNPCKVRGLGRAGGIGSGYVIMGISQRGEDINVEVRRSREQSKVVKSDRIIYQRPFKR